MRLLTLILFALVVPACAGAAQTRAGEVLNQEIEITLAPESHTLAGRSIAHYAPGTREVSYRLSPAAQVESITVSEGLVPYTFSSGVVRFRLPAGTEDGAVVVAWRVSFNDPVSRHPGASEDPSYGVSAAITPEGTFLGDGALWYPVPGQLPARRALQVSAPAGTEGVSFGRRVSRGTASGVTRSRWEESHPVGVLSVSAGPYLVEDRTVDGIELHSYLHPDNAALASRYLDAAARYLKLYSGLFGPYPFEKFAIVENFFPTGYGFPSFTLLGGSVIRLPFIVDTSFPHEIAHSWWGNAVGVERQGGNWCEGLVTYLADYLLKERRVATEGKEYRMQLLVDFASLVPPQHDFPLREFESRSDPSSRAIGYGKGAMLFHMVRSRIGDGPFFAALRQEAREHLYRAASWDDFVAAFSRASGQELAPFMNQWLTRPGGPRLSMEQVKSTREGKGWVVTGEILQQGPAPFQLEVPLRLESAGGAVGKGIAVRAERTGFRIASQDEPRRLLLDPDAEVFRVLAPGEIPATVNSIKGSTRLLGVLTKGCRIQEQGFKDLLASLSQEAAQVVHEEELERLGKGGHDLVFCGMPKDRALLPRLPEGVTVTASGFSAEQAAYSAPDGMLFLVLKQAGEGDRVAALYHPLSEQAARQYGPKITHYGKYGELLFAGGGIRQKSVVPTADGASVVDLRH